MPKFTTRSDIDIAIGKPKFQLDSRPVYYYGNGMMVYYSKMCFRIGGVQRIEYGVPDEYAVGAFHFSSSNSLKKCMGLEAFNADDVKRFDDDIIDGAISYDSTFMDVHNWAIKNGLNDYHEGITQVLVDGKMEFFNSFIQYGQYELYFCEKSKKTKISGFRFVFNE